jgi:hypothetical protein
MSTGSISGRSSSYLQSILSNALQDAGLTNKTGNTLSGMDALSVSLQFDRSQLSPFAQLMSTLQQLQQSDPAKYQQVTQQIATNLQKAAQTAQSQGNTKAADQLNQLAKDFADASQSGQLPNIQDLAKAISGHHHHHHHAHRASAEADSSSSSASSSSPSSNSSLTLSELLSALQANGTQGDALNPLGIILSTLSNAGIDVSNG